MTEEEFEEQKAKEQQTTNNLLDHADRNARITRNIKNAHRKNEEGKGAGKPDHSQTVPDEEIARNENISTGDDNPPQMPENIKAAEPDYGFNDFMHSSDAGQADTLDESYKAGAESAQKSSSATRQVAEYETGAGTGTGAGAGQGDVSAPAESGSINGTATAEAGAGTGEAAEAGAEAAEAASSAAEAAEAGAEAAEATAATAEAGAAAGASTGPVGAIAMAILVGTIIIIVVLVFLFSAFVVLYSYLTPGNILRVANQSIQSAFYSMQDTALNIVDDFWYAINPFEEDPTSDEGLEDLGIDPPVAGEDYDEHSAMDQSMITEFRLCEVAFHNAYDDALEQIPELCGDSYDVGLSQQYVSSTYPNGWEDVYGEINYGDFMCAMFFYINKEGDFDFNVPQNYFQTLWDAYVNQIDEDVGVDEEDGNYTVSGQLLRQVQDLLLDDDAYPYLYQIGGEPAVTEDGVSYLKVEIKPYSWDDIFTLIDIDPETEYDTNTTYADMLEAMGMQMKACCEDGFGHPKPIYYTLQMDKGDDVEWNGTYERETVQDVFADISDENLNENGLYIFNQLRANGYSIEGAAGICGNLYAENRFRTTMSGDQGSVGIAQWRGGRKTNLENYASAQGLPVTSIEAQTGYLLKEFEDNASYYRTESIKTATDVIAAVDTVAYYFEGCARYQTYEGYAASQYGPGKAHYISWDRFTWSETMQCYIIDLTVRRGGGVMMYNSVTQESTDSEEGETDEGE